MTKTIRNHLKDEESLQQDLDDGFNKSDTVFHQSLTKMNELLNQSAGSTWCLSIAFFLLILAVLWKIS